MRVDALADCAHDERLERLGVARIRELTVEATRGDALNRYFGERDARTFTPLVQCSSPRPWGQPRRMKRATMMWRGVVTHDLLRAFRAASFEDIVAETSAGHVAHRGPGRPPKAHATSRKRHRRSAADIEKTLTAIVD
jgi:hypothetical protein